MRCFMYLQSACRRLWAPARIVSPHCLLPPLPLQFASLLAPVACAARCETQSRLQPAPHGSVSCDAQASTKLRQTHIRWQRRCDFAVNGYKRLNLFFISSAAMAATSLPVVLCKLAQGHEHSGLVSRAAKLQGLLLPCLAKKWRVKYPQAVNVVFCSSRLARIDLV